MKRKMPNNKYIVEENSGEGERSGTAIATRIAAPIIALANRRMSLKPT
jgi:hypothetical protein